MSTNVQSKLKRWKCTCMYDGTHLNGWQSQPGGNTVQDRIEERLKSLLHTPVRIHGSGRTDSGVHAKGQVFHFDAHWPHPKEALFRALCAGRPSDIQITRVQPVASTFHARYSVRKKRYCYTLYLGQADPFATRYVWSLGKRTLDIASMQAASRLLLGTHDFSAFGALTGDDTSTENPVKTLFRLDLNQRHHKVHFTTEATGYLYKMVRSLVGSLVEVGLGKLTPEDLQAILHSRKRTPHITTAPAQGLCLERVFY